MRLPPSLSVLCLTSFVSWTIPAMAAPPDPADRLFNEGVAAMEAKRFEEGCPKLEESYHRNPRPGTLFALADCEAGRGRIATAVARYDEYLASYNTLSPDKKAKQGTRQKESLAQKATLGPLVPQLTIVLPPNAPSGTVIKRDGVEVAAALLGVAQPVDPGEHVVTMQVPGGEVTERQVTIAKGEKKQVSLPVKVASAAAPMAPAEGILGAAPGPPSDTEAPRGPSGRRLGAYVVGGVGVAGLILGGVMGGLTLGKKSVINKNCNFPGDPNGCNDIGLAAGSDAKTFALVSTVGFVVGGAAVVAAAVLFFTEPKRSAVAARGVRFGMLSAGRDGATVGLKGSW